MGYPQKHNVLYGQFVYVDEDMWLANNSKTYQRLVREYGESQIPKVGTIENSWNERGMTIKYGVAFEKIQNPHSKDGLYWFDADDIEAGIENYLNMIAVRKDESYHFCLDLFTAPNKKEETTMKTPISFDSIKKVIFSGPCTVVVFNDGEKVVVRKTETDAYDPEKAIMWAFLRHELGLSKTQMAKKMNKLIDGAQCTEKKEKTPGLVFVPARSGGRTLSDFLYRIFTECLDDAITKSKVNLDESDSSKTDEKRCSVDDCLTCKWGSLPAMLPPCSVCLAGYLQNQTHSEYEPKD